MSAGAVESRCQGCIYRASGTGQMLQKVWKKVLRGPDACSTDPPGFELRKCPSYCSVAQEREHERRE